METETEIKTDDLYLKDLNQYYYKQKYDYTTAKSELTLFFIDGVLMLSGEY